MIANGGPLPCLIENRINRSYIGPSMQQIRMTTITVQTIVM